MRCATAFLGVLLATSVAAQNRPPELAEELRALRLAVESLAESLAADREVRRAELLLKRAEIESADLQPWQTRARSTRDLVSNLERERGTLEDQMDRFEQALFDAETEQEEDELRSQREELRLYGDRLDRQIAEAEAEASAAESQADRRRALLEVLKARIDEALGIER